MQTGRKLGIPLVGVEETQQGMLSALKHADDAVLMAAMEEDLQALDPKQVALFHVLYFLICRAGFRGLLAVHAIFVVAQALGGLEGVVALCAHDVGVSCLYLGLQMLAQVPPVFPLLAAALAPQGRVFLFWFILSHFKFK